MVRVEFCPKTTRRVSRVTKRQTNITLSYRVAGVPKMIFFKLVM